MLKITKIEVQNVNYEISQEGLKTLMKNKDNLQDYRCTTSLVDIVSHIISEFEEEVKIGTFNDINDYIEYYCERICEIY